MRKKITSDTEKMKGIIKAYTELYGHFPNINKQK